MKHFLAAVCLVCALVTAGANDEKPAARPAGSPMTGQSEFTGKVAETMNAASYTYVLVDTGSRKLWAAAPRFNVKVGDTVKISAGMPMEKYQSKTLNRTFDVVYFTGNVTVNGAAAGPSPSGTLPDGHPPIGGGGQASAGALPDGHPKIGAAAASAPGVIKKLKKADGGKTVEEICANPAKLSGQKVAVRGQVVKFNSMIMDRNWIHIQDGTGKPGGNDLLVTSKVAVKVGDTIVATGVIASNKDFGAGYKYAVLMEDAEIVKE